jgi:multidrug efflux system membrane fusion protein
MKNKHQILKPMLAALALTGLIITTLPGCDANGQEKSKAPAAPAVTAAQVLERDYVEKQEFSGRLEAIERVEIRPRVGGYITAIKVRPGREVKKGALLFVIDPRPYQAELDRGEAALASAKAKAELAQLELHRAERLLEDRAIAQREYDEKAASFKELQANVRAAQAQVEAATLNLSYTQVTAPIDGRVSKEEVTLGNLVDASTLLTSIVSMDRIYASFDGDEDTYLRVAHAVQQGNSIAVHVGLANESGFPHEGELEFIDNQLDTHTGSVRMRAVFANIDRTLAPGLFARVQLHGGAHGGDTNRALMVAERAISTDQSRKYVLVVGADGKAQPHTVQLGASVDSMRVVREGLKAGDKVIVNGLQRVRPGDTVNARVVDMASKD